MTFGGYEIKGSRESGHWPSAQGTISSSSVSKRTTRDSNNRTKKTCYPKVGYHYQVDGRKYISHRIAFGTGETGGSEKWARKIVNKYPAGNWFSRLRGRGLIKMRLMSSKNSWIC